MTRQPSIHVARLIILAGCFMLLPGCITRWPDAPYLDASSSLDPESARALEQRHPGFRLISPVYRRHMENTQGQYHVVSRTFLFQDTAGHPHRGYLADNGQLTIAAILFLDTLPPSSHDRFFNGPAAMAPGGQLNGQAWRFQDPQTGTIHHEFEFLQGAKRGLGRIADAGVSASAEFILRHVDD